MSKFIFMLTHHDVTVEDALEVFHQVKDAGLECLGCKNIGLPEKELQELVSSARAVGMTTFMELVSYEKHETINSLMTAARLKVDYLIGGMPFFTDMVMKLIREKEFKTKYLPYVGGIVGHPCVLKGSIDYIVRDAERAMELGVAGINLLAYRHREEDPHELLREYIQSIRIPTVVAGDINSLERIREVTELGYWAFTIGGAVLEKKFVPDGSLRDQVTAVLDEARKATLVSRDPR
ncbi:MAG: hypothetical protein A2Z21_00340 [Candidatus Fraserbacteria bacterium RBG_16_55_9]|uniref:Uncharacterized protein n=1 Tax=Fraserbacteria sp. (strain RBG_16_55_9) TaxID=1817864 RepID=A0A1F5UTD6_FRAXR|nr:MAG: hypothetical protein A2Z21_00340 [Candidatus Fraserbacteria bacterium RBG_16_55_9]